MKLLAVSDLHYALPQFEWLVDRAPGYDAIVIAGDLLDLSSPVDLDTQIIVVSKYLDRIREDTALFVGSGNHDGDVPLGGGDFAAQWLLELGRRDLIVDGQTGWLGRDKITICPWWESQESKARMVSMLRAQASSERQSNHWIWVHHAPPNGYPVAWTGKEFAGDAILAGLIEVLQPSLVFCGHIHNAPFYAAGSWASRIGETWVFNPGRQIGPSPAFIRLDLRTMVAEYRSLETAETIRLIAASEPLPPSTQSAVPPVQ